ncbi:acetyl-CoA acetyltransferase [Microbacterium sp. RD1]|uniref:acetyl-CoA acetyltransferase n=1 Tax=Microbacterium sp. RD1 TaxID=3457313 RepID=UPI003FA5652C
MTVESQFGTDVLLVGWGHSRFGKLADEDLGSLIRAVAEEAIVNSGLEPEDIDEIYLGNFNSGLLPLAFASSLPLQASDGLLYRPATRVENACASGSAALHQGVKSLLAGTARHVLVIGAEKMTHAATSVVGAALLGADYETAGRESDTGFAGLFARTARAYEERYGEVADALGMIAAKNHRNGVANPYAQIRKDLGVEFCQTVSERNPVVAHPLRRTDCSPISDGAAALVLSAQRVIGAAAAPVRLSGFGQASDFLPAARRDPTAFAGSAVAWNRALEMAEVAVGDLDLVEVHDCFTIAELIMYEVMGLTEAGSGRRAVEEGWVQADGRLPVNLSGGLKAKGHPVGATGVSQHVLAAMQLSGTAGEMQRPGARRAAVHNMGGLAVANYVSVLEAV